MSNKMNQDRNGKKDNRDLKYNRNEKRVNDTFAKEEMGEDATAYGEFIPSAFAWIPPEKQKTKAKEIESITEQKDNNVRTGDKNKDNYKKKE